MTKYKQLGCERCKNRRAYLKSRQGLFCEQMIMGEKSVCPKFKLDKNAPLWN
jgi:hypothetical protein